MFPDWLVSGIAITAVLAAVFTVAFVVGERLFPTAQVRPADAYSGEWKRRREIREYLRAIDEPFAEDHVVAGSPVAFYLPQRDVAITFDAPAYFRLQASASHVVLAEHEMPGVHLGSRLPFEPPDVDLGQEKPETDPVAAAYETLGVAQGATTDEVKAAYRERVKEVHPDHGGDEEAFREVREAYAIARQDAEGAASR